MPHIHCGSYPSMFNHRLFKHAVTCQTPRGHDGRHYSERCATFNIAIKRIIVLSGSTLGEYTFITGTDMEGKGRDEGEYYFPESLQIPNGPLLKVSWFLQVIILELSNYIKLGSLIVTL